jgi:hypothetical protein
MKTLSRSLFLAVLFSGFLATLEAQTTTVIPDTEAALHVGQQATVEGTVLDGAETFVFFEPRVLTVRLRFSAASLTTTADLLRRATILPLSEQPALWLRPHLRAKFSRSGRPFL